MNAPEAPTASVIGANFAGLASTIGLLRAGVAATAYERAPTLERLQGAKGGIHLWPNALQALRLLGALDRVLECSVECVQSTVVTTDARQLTVWPFERFKEKLGLPVVFIMRRD